MDNLLVKDFARGEQREITIPGAYLRRIIEPQMHGDVNLEAMLVSLPGITAQTGREMSTVEYSAIPRDIEQAKSIRSRVIQFSEVVIVPSLGNFKSVPEPEFYGSEWYNSFWLDKSGNPEIVVPLIHVHTHPDSSSYTSEGDLKNAVHRSRSLTNRFSILGVEFALVNPTLNIIVGRSDLPGNLHPSGYSFTFYQLTGDTGKIDDFINRYEANHSIAKDRPGKSKGKLSLTEAFMEVLKEAGVCKYLHFPARNETRFDTSRTLFFDELTPSPKPDKYDQPGHIRRKHLEKIASIFGYKMGIQRLT